MLKTFFTIPAILVICLLPLTAKLQTKITAASKSWIGKSNQYAKMLVPTLANQLAKRKEEKAIYPCRVQ